MKTIIVLLLMTLLSHVTIAQTTAEWTQQKKTQKKYLLKQIALLQDYITRAGKGYKIAKDGLGFIGDMKNGEFNLHKSYFSSLKNVNPAIARYVKIKEIITLQADILKNCRQVKLAVGKGGMIGSNEMNYISGVFNRVLDNCSNLIDQLIDITTSGTLEMKDDERIRRIDQLHIQMQDNYSFVQDFSSKAKLLAAARRQDLNDIQTSRMLNGIKP